MTLLFDTYAVQCPWVFKKAFTNKMYFHNYYNNQTCFYSAYSQVWCWRKRREGGFSDYSWRSAVVAAGHVACAHVNDRKECRGEGEEEEIAAESGGRSPTQQRLLFSPPAALRVTEGTSCVFATPAAATSVNPARPTPPVARHLLLDIINNAAARTLDGTPRAHGQGNPGNNMRTLSLSRTLAEDLRRCRLP